MNVAPARAAIRRMATLPRPRRARPAWTWIYRAPTLAFVFGALGRIWSWLLLALVLALGLGLLPLFGILGFELATATAIFAAIMGLDIGSALARELQAQPAEAAPGRTVDPPAPPFGGADGRGQAPTVAGSALVAAGVAGGIALVPGLVAAVRGIWVPTCDWWFGVESYAVMPLATAVLAAALGHAVGAIIGPRRIVGALAAQLVFVALLLAALLRFYGAPAVFNYTPIVGYFPGNLYDENLQLGAPLAWARLEQLAWVVAILALVAARLDPATYRVRLRAPLRWPALAIAALALAGGAALYHASGALGYRVDASDIVDELGGTVETPHFVIHYAHTPEIDADIQLIAADHELRYGQVVAQLGAAPEGKLTSFYFADRDQKARLMGARDVEMAKPWRHEIYLDHRAWPHPALRHEIAHAVASAFGDWLFHVASRRVLGLPLLASPGLIEGLAVAIDWPGAYDRPTPHESVRALQAMGVEPTIRELLSLRFFGVSSARGYTTAGSFLKFLLDTYGAAPLRALYASGGDFEGAYHQSMLALEAQWQKMIATIALPPAEVEASRERFRGTSVFERPCPHAIAARREKAVDALAAGDRPRAIELMRHVCDNAPEEPRYRMELGDFLVSGTAAEREEAQAIWLALATDAERVTSSLRADAYERLAKLLLDFAQRRALLGEAAKLPVDPGERRQLDAEIFALDRSSPAGPALRMYFFGHARGLDPRGWALIAALVEPELGFAHYLHGLQLQNGPAPDWKQAAAELATGIRLGLPGPAFVRNGARRLAIAGYRAGDRASVELAIATLADPAMTASDQLLAADWRARLATSR